MAGFIDFPSGVFKPDPAGDLKSKGPAGAYDRVYRRWLPVDWRWVSDDGSSYVYATYSSDVPNTGETSVIHLVNVSTGVDRVVLKTGQYAITDYVGTGVYLTAWVGGHGGPGPEVGWVLNPTTGAVRALTGGEKYGQRIGAGAGWRDDIYDVDPNVPGMPAPNRITRIDLRTGAEATWFYERNANSVSLMAFDMQGHPLVASTLGDSFSVWRLTDAAHRTELFSGKGFPLGAIADSHGVWISDGTSTYLYMAGLGVQKVSRSTGRFAGGCH